MVILREVITLFAVLLSGIAAVVLIFYSSFLVKETEDSLVPVMAAYIRVDSPFF